ncbi:MAG: hypothetical protein KKD64_12395 [Alphaproteobacteria bacterium]|nr:hypothetical protein [Alphaproteobacteria bacterium]MBU0794604.1 hypothetical protein [Alphaproteobacteria bacterium]MBU1770433.1 hypothetical protein [Alphaproteobacteria bacterium]
MQLMILLSALLASLSGLMVGDSRTAHAQVELSATPDLAQSDEQVITVAQALSYVPAVVPALRSRIDPPALAHAPVRGGRTSLAIKQSWLI